MTSLDVPAVPHPTEGASPHSSTSRSRTVHSRQMSSLSMNTTTTSQSHHPSDSLLHSAERTQQPSQHPPRPDPSAQTKEYWEGINVRRIRRWGLSQGVLLSVMGSWASYTAVRYFIAYRVFPDRRPTALPLGISSVLSILLVIALAMSFILPYHIIERRPQSRYLIISPHYILQFLLSFFLFAPTIVNLVLVCVWRNIGSGLSLRGRCHWSPDVVWVGVGGQCSLHAPAWGVWLTAAILRLILTAIFLVAYYFASRSYRTLRVPVSYRPEDVRRMDPVEISHIAQVDAPSRPSLVVHPFVHRSGGIPQRSLSSSRMEVIPERSDTPNREHYEQENTAADSAESSTLSDEEESKQRSAESGATATNKSLRRTNSSRDMDTQMASSSSRLATLVANAGEEELQGFADQFRALVDRVSRELEESRLAEDQDGEPHTPPLHRVLDTHTPYMTIDEFGREVYTEEPIAILGSVIKRMPTIESVGSRELTSLRSATLVSGGGGGAVGAASLAPSSSTSSRPPTGATMASFSDAASASLASASQPSSRSNSIHRLRTPSELGELVRDALRARAQARPLPPPPPSSSVRPGSGGSVSGSGCTGSGSGSGSGSGESAVGLGPSASSRSRSNSLGPNEVLSPVTEHGELGREDSNLPLRRPPRRLGGDVSEVGEILRTEWSRSWTSNSPSATSTAYFTASTTGSLVVTGSGGGGGDTGTGSTGGGPQMRT